MFNKSPKKAVVVLGGELIGGCWVKDILKSSDIIVAADNGISHCIKLGVEPDISVGDFDSILPKNLTAAKKLGWEIKQFPEDKDKTDGQLAVEEALNLGAETITIIAGIRGDSRFDHGLGNILLLTYKHLAYKDIRLIEKNIEISLITSAAPHPLNYLKNSIVSLIPLTDPVKGVKTKGLKYNLSTEDLNMGHTRGISNIILKDDATISVLGGLLLVILEKSNLP